MHYPHASRRVAGVLVPVSALRSEHSAGCGEFADLPALGTWCRDVGLALIQILPVNDTGSDSSPYSALSAFALHPIYVRIRDIPELVDAPSDLRASVAARTTELGRASTASGRFSYTTVVATKLEILRTVFDRRAVEITKSAALGDFVERNEWIPGYAVYRALKDRFNGAHWREWPAHSSGDADSIRRLWNDDELRDDTRFHAWVQMRLAEQLKGAATELDKMGVALKGDIPILMNDDSADVWQNPEVFRTELRAGAPPDMFSDLGQNWGFPIYNWQRLESEDYSWWRNRLALADQVYHAFRIDHVLGFFRIWAIPASHSSGALGFFWPQHGLTTDQLAEAGFDEGRVRWLAEPHMTGAELREALGESVDSLLGSVLRRLGSQDLYNFSEEVAGERDLEQLDLPDDRKGRLLAFYRDRAFVRLPDGAYAPAWTFRDCSRFQRLAGHERERLEDLVASRGAASNELWASHGRTVLGELQQSVSMLACAEDLGVVPEAVPRVLGELGILGLRIPRWTADWDAPGQPLIPFHRYPELSVCAPSVHDTSTMRGWWETESGREALWGMIAGDAPCPTTFDPETARTVLGAIMKCGSRIVVLAIQDLFGLVEGIQSEDPADDRVNVPGTYNEFNWTWRMPLKLNELRGDATLATQVKELVAQRG